MVGRKFGRWTVVGDGGRNNRSQKHWMCECECGNAKRVVEHRLKSGESKSCGCLRSEITSQRVKQHGMRHTKVYSAWESLRARCNNPRNNRWALYGGRGINVCDRWDNSFENFFEDMGDLPFPKAQIDRIDTDGNYEPGNCRWASPTENARNRRNNVVLIHDGQTMCVAEWAEKLSVSPFLIYSRINNGWPVERALTV